MDEETSCGGKLEFIIKTTAYLTPGKSTADSLDDYETVGTWKLFRGLTLHGDLFPLTTGNFRGKKLKLGIVNVCSFLQDSESFILFNEIKLITIFNLHKN